MGPEFVPVSAARLSSESQAPSLGPDLGHFDCTGTQDDRIHGLNDGPTFRFSAPARAIASKEDSSHTVPYALQLGLSGPLVESVLAGRVDIGGRRRMGEGVCRGR